MRSFCLVLLIGVMVLVDIDTTMAGSIWKRDTLTIFEESVLEQIRKHDADGNGELNRDEYWSSVPKEQRHVMTREKVDRIVQSLDTDKTGGLSLRELKAFADMSTAEQDALINA